jgi:hypothetical protein
MYSSQLAQLFGGKYCLHLQGRNVSQAIKSQKQEARFLQRRLDIAIRRDQRFTITTALISSGRSCYRYLHVCNAAFPPGPPSQRTGSQAYPTLAPPHLSFLFVTRLWSERWNWMGKETFLWKRKQDPATVPAEPVERTRILLRNPCISNFITIPSGHQQN